MTLEPLTTLPQVNHVMDKCGGKEEEGDSEEEEEEVEEEEEGAEVILVTHKLYNLTSRPLVAGLTYQGEGDTIILFPFVKVFMLSCVLCHQAFGPVSEMLVH